MDYQCTACNCKTQANINGLCWDCSSMETNIRQQNAIARKTGLVCDLTLTQWLKTIAYFKKRCAYCGEYTKSIFIEHFIPVKRGGGTTASNCVPACTKCNTRKGNLLPDQIKHIPRERLEKVRVFLEKQK